MLDHVCLGQLQLKPPRSDPLSKHTPHTRMPTVLTENFFMDNEDESCNILMTDDGRQQIIDYHVSAIRRIGDEIL